MKFNHLKASISNNADQTPSLYMALCMVESLFMDMEDQCGKELPFCPAGDERLSTKLVWLCRCIQDIYKGKSDDLQRNRSRLDSAMAKLDATRTSLAEFASVTEQLAALESEYSDLEKKLEKQKAAAQECKILTGKCAQAKQDLENLRSFDPEAAKKELDQVTGEIASLETTKNQLTEQLKKTQASAKQLRLDAETVQGQEKAAQKTVTDLTDDIKRIQKKTDRLREDLKKLEADKKTLIDDEAKLIRLKDDAEIEAAALREKISQYRSAELEPQQKELDKVRGQLTELEKQKGTVIADYETLEKQRKQLVLDIGHQKTENDALKEKLPGLEERLKGMRDAKTQLTNAHSEYIGKLESLQADVELLHTKTIPEAQNLLKEENLRHQGLSEKLKLARNQCETLRKGSKQLQEDLPKLEEEVQKANTVYRNLTAHWEASSKDLEKLKADIAELREKNDAEKVETYRKQLEDSRKNLENLQNECARLKEDLRLMNEALENAKNECTRLEKEKCSFESQKADKEQLMKELAPFATESHIRRAAELEAQVKLLETVRGKLVDSITNMHNILGTVPVSEEYSLEDQMKQELRILNERIEDLRHALLNCAKSIKMEER